MSMKRSGRLAWLGAGVLVLAAAGAWQFLRPAPDDGSFVRGNGRIEGHRGRCRRQGARAGGRDPG
jgi:HlyD family secretion protein